MGSKYALLPVLADTFASIGGGTALDAFSGSGVVSYLLKSMGYAVTSNDFLNFPHVIAAATVANQDTRLSTTDIAQICGPSTDGRSFIQDTFRDIFFSTEDLAFLDSAWSHIDSLPTEKQSLAKASLVLASAKRQPRGVFTFASKRYDDGRRDLHVPFPQLFRECAQRYNDCVFAGQTCESTAGDVFALKSHDWDIVYLDPPYTPPRDDNDYIKRYHFLEGLSCYWRGQEVMESSVVKKLPKRFTPFAYKRTVEQALNNLFAQFSESTIVLSYGNNAVPNLERLTEILSKHKTDIQVTEVSHRYHFGTHATAKRRGATEYVIVAR